MKAISTKVHKGTKSTSKKALALKREAARQRRHEKDALLICNAKAMLKEHLGIDAEIVSTARHFYVASFVPTHLEKNLDLILKAALDGLTVETLEMPQEMSLKAAAETIRA